MLVTPIILHCGACGKELDDSDFITLKTPVPVSEYDYQYNHTRTGVYVCCGMIRMIDANTDTLLAYPIPPGE